MKSVIIDQSNGLAPEIEPTEIAIPEELEQAIELGIPYEGSIPLTLSADVPINPSQLKVSKENRHDHVRLSQTSNTYIYYRII